MTAGDERPPRPERVDVRRSRRRILDAAAQVLGEDAAAGMSTVAERAGVSRATIYRHYPTREQLVAAVDEELVASVSAIIAEHAATEGLGAADALARIVEDLIDERARYSILFEWHDRTPLYGVETKRRWDEPLLQLIERGQRAGELAGDVRARVILVALSGLTRRALRGYVDGEVTLEEAKLLAARGLRSGFATG